ncbi:hypothetical protein MMK73_004316 [Providencia rettgeri]|nr:hypothetical protein [Providencia rettgeri]
MEFKHSPAPWIATKREFFIELYDDNGSYVGLTNSTANAHLIAAAPELLEALQSIQQSLAKYIEVANNIGVEATADGFYLGHAIDVEEKARQAISKALGQQ